MATIQSFNGLMRSFIEELCHTFPEDETLHMCFEGFDALVKVNARKPLELFMESLGPYAQHILTKDPALFQQPIPLSGIDLKTYWDAPGLSEASRNAIWQYLQTLYMIASTVSAVPPELLQAIETVAQDCATKIQSGEADFASITNMLLNPSPDGSGGIASLLGNMLAPSSTASSTPSLEGLLENMLTPTTSPSSRSLQPPNAPKKKKKPSK